MNYVWLTWSVILLAVWLIIYLSKPEYRKVMLRMSLLTMLFGFTEPLFVPEYWNPPSLFDLAQKTGFDIESFLFSFSIGGIGTVTYWLFTGGTWSDVTHEERVYGRHTFHYYILILPLVLFLLLSLFTGLDHIYCGIISLFVGGLGILYCRPDLKAKIWIGGLVFTGLYFIYFSSLNLVHPGYVEQVWNLEVLSGIWILNIPLEEYLFAFTFGLYWSGLYEHMQWRTIQVKSKGNTSRNILKIFNLFEL